MRVVFLVEGEGCSNRVHKDGHTGDDDSVNVSNNVCDCCGRPDPVVNRTCRDYLVWCILGCSGLSLVVETIIGCAMVDRNLIWNRIPVVVRSLFGQCE
jgi:hypothetical protein